MKNKIIEILESHRGNYKSPFGGIVKNPAIHFSQFDEIADEIEREICLKNPEMKQLINLTKKIDESINPKLKPYDP